MSTLSIAEVVDKLQKSKTKNERFDILKSNNSLALKGILKLNYDNNFKLDLPDGAPPFKKLNVPQGFGNTTLLSSAKTWYVFTKIGAPNIKQSKREFLFIQLLENLDPFEADILVLAKDKKLDLGLTNLIINEVFPDLILNKKSEDGDKEIKKRAAKKSGSKNSDKSA